MKKGSNHELVMVIDSCILLSVWEGAASTGILPVPAGQNHAFNTYMDEQEKDYATYVKEVEAKWGQFIGSTNKTWVDYGNDKRSRGRVDFEHGTVTVDVLVQKEAKDPLAVAIPEIQTQLKRLLSNQWPTDENPLASQIEAENGKTLNADNVNSFVRDKLAAKLTVSEKKISQKSASGEKIVSVQIPMVPGHLRIRAERYKPIVDRECAKYHIDHTIVFGVIHTESYFNPMARSSVPAFGLMQLVPSSGAKDAYRYVFKGTKTPSAQYLYNPENNIALGVGYLALTKNVYFAGLKDPAVAYLMTVAAYNTGAGNVARALTGTTSISKAVAKAQHMNAVQVHEVLEKKLPYEETQNYIQRVFSRAKLYRGL